MVRRSGNFWFCEFNGCGEGYRDEASAVQCEEQGLRGPDIRKGTVIGEKEGYIVLIGDSKIEKHDRVYPRLKLDLSLEKMQEVEDVTFSIDDLTFNVLEGLVQWKCVRQLSAEELNEFLKAIKEEDNMYLVRAILERHDVNNFYRGQEYFGEG